jgi:hypothetical protein
MKSLLWTHNGSRVSCLNLTFFYTNDAFTFESSTPILSKFKWTHDIKYPWNTRAHFYIFLDDSCTLQPFGSPGVCKLMSHCKYAVKQLHKYSYYPQICGVQRREPIVCCPNKNKIRQVRKPGEMSKKSMWQILKEISSTYLLTCCSF